MISFMRSNIGLVTLLTSFFIVGLLRINDLSLYTDSTRYVIWGSSLAQGRGWIDDTQPTPESYVVNAPLYPVLLAPALALFPLSLAAAKVWTLLWGVLALLLFHQWLRSRFSPATALAGTMILAFNPMTVVLFTEALSEAPFVALMIGIFLLSDRVMELPTNKRPLLFLVAMLSLGMLFREVSITLIIAVALTFLIRREPKRALLVIGGAAALYGLWLLRNLVLVGTPSTSQSTNLQFIFQHVVTPPDAPLATELFTRFLLNLKGFGTQLAGMYFYSVPTTLVTLPSEVFRTLVNAVGSARFIIMVVVAPLMLGGLILDVRRSTTGSIRLLFLLGYLGIVLTYPIHDVRFLLPLLPLMIYNALLSLQWLTRRSGLKGFRDRLQYPVVLAAVLLVPNGVCILEIITTNLAYRADPEAFHARTHSHDVVRTYFSEPWGLLGEWIRAHVPEDAVIACSAKELAPFIAPRKLLEINAGVPRPVFERMIRDNATTHVVAVGVWEDFTSYEFIMAESERFRFDQVHDVANLRVFQVRSRWLAPRGMSFPPSALFDTTTVSGLVRKGRQELLLRRYELADSALAQADRIRPHQPLILFQQLLLNTFREDSARAIQTLGQMFSTPRATPYLWAARQHVDAMNTARSSRRITVPELQSLRLYEVARLYWDLGYPYQSYSLLQDILRTDTSSFTGLLWMWHYGIQLGDTASAARRLEMLEHIDPSNAVVRGFRTMTRLFDRLRATGDAGERRRIRISISREYEMIDLPEEALDEAERAVGEDVSNPEGWEAYAALLERLGKDRATAAVRKTKKPTASHGLQADY